eukprot:m51a1_g11058 hypothetical protein (796) ;mRNA; r:519980-523091
MFNSVLEQFGVSFAGSHKKKSKKLQAEAVRQVSELLARVADLPGPAAPWPRVFHERLVVCGVVVSPELLELLAAAAREALAAVRSCSPRWKAAAERLLEYARTHTQDPDNALVGVEPSRSVLEVCPALHEAGAGLPGAAELAEMIRGWAEMYDDDLVRSVRAYAATLPAPLRRGSLVVVRRRDSAVFARLAQDPPASGDTLSVYTDPNEAAPVECPKSEVAPFPRQMEECLASLRGLLTLVTDPCAALYVRITSESRENVEWALGRHGVDLALVERVERGGATLWDVAAIEKSVALLRRLDDDNLTTALINKVNEAVVANVTPLLKSVDEGLPLLPVLGPAAVKQLTETDFSQLACNLLSLSGRSKLFVLEGALETLKKQREDIVSGETKKTITSTYLALIREHVDRFLRERGFDLTAIPEDYLDRPPADMAAVRQNLAILRAHVFKGERSADLQTMIDILKPRIYETLDEYVTRVQDVVLVSLGLDKSEESWRRALEMAKSQTQEQTPLAKQVRALVADVEYVARMKELESLGHTNCLDCVPVTGLILSRFARLDNELQTRALALSRQQSEENDQLTQMISRSIRTADVEKRRRERHPSTTPRVVRCLDGLNQRVVGHVNACTSYAIAFVSRARWCASEDITPEFLCTVLMDPGVALPDTSSHPDPVDAVTQSNCGLAAVTPTGSPARDAVTVGPTFVPYDSLGALLREQLPRIAGCLVVNGTETFGVAALVDGRVALFDPHGDSTQTEPAMCCVYDNAEAAVLGVSDFVDERSVFHREITGDATDVVLLSSVD